MDRFLENGSHPWKDRLKVYRFSWPSSASLVPTINCVACFLFLPVFLQILLCELTAQDFQRNLAPTAPTLSWSPSHQILVKGEYIKLICSPPEGQKGENYIFNRMNEKGDWKRYQEQIGNTLLIPALRMAPKATFSCFYMGRNREGRRALSRKSNWGKFSVIEPPPAPSLSPDPPEPLYLVGENITLLCSAPNLPLQDWRRYQFSHTRHNENETSIKDLDWHEGNISPVLTATREDSGLYKCRFLEWKYEREIPSKWSHLVSIVVRDPLPPPVLELHPSSGSLGEGKVLSILCLSSKSNNTKRFHFSQDGVEMTSSNEEPVKSSRDSGLLTLNMLVALLYAKNNESLQFACRYEENINGRWIMSPWSKTLNATVEVPTVWNLDFDFIWSYARMSIPLIILLVPLAFYCRKKKSNVEITYSCTQDAFTPSSPEPTRKNHLIQEKTGETLYLNRVFQPRKKQQNHP